MGLSAPQLEQTVDFALVANIPLFQTRSETFSNWKDMADAEAARGDVFAALLAGRGISRPAPIFEGKAGFVAAVSGPSTLDVGSFGGRTGAFMIGDARFKFYPVQAFIQTAVPPAVRLIKRVGVTAIFVTHDQGEAMVLADRIRLLQGGAVVQDGSPRHVYEEPATRFAMDFLGTSNFPAGSFEGETRWRLPAGDALDVGAPGTLVGIRPERIDILPAGTAGANILSGRIRDAVFLGASTIHEVETGGTVVQVASTHSDHPVGSAVSLWFPTRWLKRVAA